MSQLLRIDASSRVAGSHSRELADFFVRHWQARHDQGRVIVRDLAGQPVPHLSALAAEGFFVAEPDRTDAHRQAVAPSDELVDELLSADALLIATPMYNFSIPSALKAWIDQVVRVGRTFAYSPQSGFEGLVKNRPAYVITATGASFADEGMKALDFLSPYLSTLLGFLGFSQVEFFPVEGTTTDEALLQRTLQQARQRIQGMGEGR